MVQDSGLHVCNPSDRKDEIMRQPNGILLRSALRLERGAVVSFVGAGGKTSAMLRLARELRAIGWRIVVTTTTHLAETQVSSLPGLLRSEELQRLSSRLDEFGQCIIVGSPDDQGRVQGVSPGVIADLHARSDVDAILVEADGSRSRPFKAPAEHEPVVPPATTHLIPTVGVEILGQTLNDTNVHRPERVAHLAATALGSPITIETVARILVHPWGGAKHLPAGAQMVPLINKVDRDEVTTEAQALAERLLDDGATRRVLLASRLCATPVCEVRARVAGIVLAAGRATRFGATKQLMPWRDSTLVGRAAQVALDAGLRSVIVVTGHEADRVGAAVAGLPVQVVFNAAYASGQSSSMKRGLAALPAGFDAAIFLLADQPGVTPEVVKALVQAHRTTLAPVVLPTCAGRRGNPVLFDVSLFPEMAGIEGDVGGRALLDKYAGALECVPVEEPGILADIDTPEDRDRWCKS
jgi:molybdenum cofactor cytidylyltransferase